MNSRSQAWPGFPRLSHLAGPPVSAIIPAYNEAVSIGPVLDALLPVARLDQILVVDDGSDDNTSDIVRSHCAVDPRVRLIRLAQNGGKAQAMLIGAAHAHNDLVLFLDGDLVALQPKHLRALIRPVAAGESEMAIALFADGRTATDWSHKIMPFLSGQRCLRWSRFADTLGFADAGWSIEVGLTLHARRKGYPIAWVEWPGVTHRMRPEKRSGLAGYWSHMRMWADIGRYMLAQTGTLLADNTLHPAQIQQILEARKPPSFPLPPTHEARTETAKTEMPRH